MIAAHDSRTPITEKISRAADSFSLFSEHECAPREAAKIFQYRADTNPLFKAYKELGSKLSYYSLAQLPSPVYSCKNLEKLFPKTKLFVKDDGAFLPGDSPVMGANKIRKLNYILADALAIEAKSIITFGCVGSNHLAQVALSASSLGLTCYNLMLNQHKNSFIERNLALQSVYGAHLVFCSSQEERRKTAILLYEELREKEGVTPYVIPTGGSSARGTVGYVQAAYELIDQIQAGALTMPDLIYLPVGSAGIAAGILLGLASLKLPIHVVCVLTEPDNDSCALASKIEKLFYATQEFIRSYDSSFPRCLLSDMSYAINSLYAGESYGLCTPEAAEAIAVMSTYENLILDEVYSSKTFAALLNDLKEGVGKDKTVLFWNSFCSFGFLKERTSFDSTKLPDALRAYF